MAVKDLPEETRVSDRRVTTVPQAEAAAGFAGLHK